MTHKPPAEHFARDPDARADAVGATPRWYWLGLGVIMLGSLLMSSWALSRNEMGNGYYTAAMLAGSQSWTAAFFGSLDTSLFLTVDKPAPGLWPDVLVVRLFGLNSWSVLLPYFLAGVATVALLADSVRRIWGPRAALLAAATVATTPVAVAVNRSNLPEPFLILSLVASAWALLRGLESGRTGWLVAAMVFVGLGFNAKLLQAWIVLPALGLTWLFFASGPMRRRAPERARASGPLGHVCCPRADARTIRPAPHRGSARVHAGQRVRRGHPHALRRALRGDPGDPA